MILPPMTVGQSPATAYLPAYQPPNIRSYSASQLFVPAGRYHKAGHRFRGQYQDLANIANYWDVGSNLTPTITGAYSAGSSSGVVGGKVASSWYSVFMTGGDTNGFMLLPYVKPSGCYVSSGNTVLNIAPHVPGWTSSMTYNPTSNLATNYAGYHARMVLPAASLSTSGNCIRITLRSADTQFYCDHVSIVERSGSTYNGTTTPTEIKFGGISGVTNLPLPNTALEAVSDPTFYQIDETKDYLLCFDFTAAVTMHIRYNATGGTWYEVAGQTGWNVQNMPGSPTTQTYTGPCVKVEVQNYDAGFLTADDQFNTYRLVNYSLDAYDGNVYTIADCANGTPDTLTITGDKTAEMQGLNWFQMIPPAATPSVYLGSVQFDGSGNLAGFIKNGNKYLLTAPVAGTTLTQAYTSNPINLELGKWIPPVACAFTPMLYLYYNGSSWVQLRIFNGLFGTTCVFAHTSGGSASVTHVSYEIPLSAVGMLREATQNLRGGVEYLELTADTFQMIGFSE